MAPLSVRPTGSSSQPGKIGTQRFGSGYRIGGATAPGVKPMGVRAVAKPSPEAPPPATESGTETPASENE
jgi:hypothetical protein